MRKEGRYDQWREPRKTERFETKEYRYYIFCEGEQTEPNYFQGFKKLIESNPIYKDMVQVEIEPCGAETMRVIGAAEAYVEDNKIKKGQIWCVYDKDSFPAERFNGVVERANVLNKSNKDVQYHTAWSNECIEFWFILHFDFYTSNNNRSFYISYLNDKFKKLGLTKYKKNDKSIFHILQTYGDEEKAVRYAEKILSENTGKTPSEIAPGTRVHELVKELRKYCREIR